MGTGEKMTTPMDEMFGTFERAYWSAKSTPLANRRAALVAAVAEHLPAMLAEAWKQGAIAQHGIEARFADCTDNEHYAARIIASLTQDPARDV